MNLEVKNIVKAFEESENIDSIFLFGSRSKGNFTEGSDYDFGVVYKNFIDNDLDRKMRSQMLAMNLSKKFGKNLILLIWKMLRLL